MSEYCPHCGDKCKWWNEEVLPKIRKNTLQKVYTIRDMNKIVEDARRQERNIILTKIEKMKLKGRWIDGRTIYTSGYNQAINDIIKIIEGDKQ